MPPRPQSAVVDYRGVTPVNDKNDIPRPPSSRNSNRISMFNFETEQSSQYNPRSSSITSHPPLLQRQSVASLSLSPPTLSSSPSTSRSPSPLFQYSSVPYPPLHTDKSFPFQATTDSSLFKEETMTLKSNTPGPTSRPLSAMTHNSGSLTPNLPENRLSVMSSTGSLTPNLPENRMSVMSTSIGHRSSSATSIETLPKLELPVVVPQAAAGAGLPFCHAYAPILEYYGIDSDGFLEFIDGLNKVCASQSKTAQYMQRANETLFKPRRLRVSIVGSQPLAERLKYYDWTELASELTPDQMEMSVVERRIIGFKDRIASLHFEDSIEQQSGKRQSSHSHKYRTVDNLNQDLIAQRRRTMIHQDWFNPLEAYKQNQPLPGQKEGGDKELEKKIKHLSVVQIKADKKKAKGMAKLDKAKKKEVAKMKKSLDKDQAQLEKENKRSIQDLGKELKQELDEVNAEIKEYEQFMSNKQVPQMYINADPTMINFQKQKREIIDNYTTKMDREMQFYENNKRRRQREFEVEKSDYERVYDQNALSLQKVWNKEMGRTDNNRRDKEVEMLRITQWILIDSQ